MPYATQTDIERAAGGLERLIELTDWDNSGSVDESAIIHAQNTADSWIDSFAALRYATPIANPSLTIVNVAAQEAVYQLKRARNAVTEIDEKDHKDRLDWLVMLSQGKVRPSDPAPAKSSAVTSKVVVNNRDVSRSKLRGFS